MQIQFIKTINLLLLFVSCSAFAQNITLKGKVLDAETNRPVEFANLGIMGSFSGTASDFNGDFELKISEEYKGYTVRVSAVGYRAKEVLVDDLVSGNGVLVKLLPQNYGIDQVEVMAESKRLYGILKAACNLIDDNYMQAYQAKVYFSQIVDGEAQTEMALNFFDKNGYGNRSFSNALESRGYCIGEVRRNFDQKPVFKGLIRTDDVLEFDIVKVRGNVLDVAGVDRFNLELVDEVVYNNDSAWVIGYKLDKPRFAETGDENVISYSGLIYVSMTDNAILRNELEVVSKGYHIAGRSSALDGGSGNYSYRVNSNYRKALNDKYALSKIEYIGKGEESIEMIWVVYDYDSLKANASLDRQYYSFKKEKPDFWNRFILPE